MTCLGCRHAKHDDWHELECRNQVSKNFEKSVEDEDTCENWQPQRGLRSNLQIIREYSALEMAEFIHKTCKTFCEEDCTENSTDVERLTEWLEEKHGN